MNIPFFSNFSIFGPSEGLDKFLNVGVLVLLSIDGAPLFLLTSMLTSIGDVFFNVCVFEF